MKFNIKTLDGKDKIWKPTSNSRSEVSKLHAKARELLVAKYSTIVIMEEVYFPLYASVKRAFDFFIPSLQRVIEVQGEQHFKFTPYFHATSADFRREQIKDLQKIAWCELNNFELVHLCHFEKEEEWIKKI